MTVSEKIKTIDNKIEPNKAQYELDRQTAKIAALLSENISKYQFLTGKDGLPEKYLLEKAATSKRFEYATLGSELTKQTDLAKDQYKFFKDQINVNNNREDDVKTENSDKIVEDMSGKSNVTKECDAILKDIKNNGRTTKSISGKSCGNNINLESSRI